MDAKRLEQLIDACQGALNDEDSGMAAYLTTADIADLARCAAAWAKVERQKGNGAALYVNSKTFTWFHDDNDFANGSTAIAAVEAAPEVKP